MSKPVEWLTTLCVVILAYALMWALWLLIGEFPEEE